MVTTCLNVVCVEEEKQNKHLAFDRTAKYKK